MGANGGEKLFKVSVLQGAPNTTNKKTKKIHIEGATQFHWKVHGMNKKFSLLFRIASFFC